MKARVGILLLLLMTGILPLAAAVTDHGGDTNLLNNPESVVYDSSRCRYLVSNWGDGNIIAIDSTGTQTPFNTEMDQAAGLHIVGNIIYAASTEGSVTGIVAFDLTSGDRIYTMDIPEKELLNDITSDGSDYLYVTDCDANKIFFVRLSDMTYGTLVDSGLGYPNGIIYDEASNSLLVLNGGLVGRPLLSVSLVDTSLSVIAETGLNSIDGLSVDDSGNTYFSSWATDKVYRYDPSFANPPEVISEGHSDPADIYVNRIDNILAVPNFNGNSVDLVPLDPQSSASGGETVQSEPCIRIFPNPFRHVTRMEPNIPSGVPDGNLSIYSLDGRLVRTLSDPGESSSFIWNGADNHGNRIPAGIYVAVLETPSLYVSGRVIVLE